ncbi:OadG family transporter subunit [Pseudomonas sp. SL4(2022)]|uniref:OadG family transporter subunit n=1 Tax=Pseudomonas sp. SL4(2022) TaxID=2994661 RepID=UPI003B63C37B
MTLSELLFEGVELMLFGMSFVFLFLVLLVLMTRVMSWVIAQFAVPTPVVQSSSPLARLFDGAEAVTSLYA